MVPNIGWSEGLFFLGSTTQNKTFLPLGLLLYSRWWPGHCLLVRLMVMGRGFLSAGLLIQQNNQWYHSGMQRWSCKVHADPFVVELQQTVFNQEMDKCTGIGRPRGLTQQGLRIRHYTQGPRYIKWLFKEIWKCRVPPTVRIFGYLLLRDRLLTREH